MMPQFLPGVGSVPLDADAPETVRDPAAGRFEAGVFVGGLGREPFQDVVGSGSVYGPDACVRR